MTSDEYKDLVEFIGIRLDRTDGRLAAVVDRLTRVEINQESMRDDLRAVAEQVGANSRKIEDNGIRIETLTSRVDALTSGFNALASRFDGMASRFDGLEATVSTRFDDHERRIVRLE